MRIIQLLLIGWVLVLNAPPAFGADASTRPFQRDMIALTHSASRIIGSKGYQAAGDYLQSHIRAIPGVDLRVQQFPVMVPVTQSASIDPGGGHSEPVYPFWPAHVRVCSTPPDGITGNLIYVAEAQCDQLRPASLRGQIAVVEASARQQWMEAANLGPRALLILGSSHTGWPELQSQDIRVPVNLPRFYVPPGPFADSLRAGKFARATLHATVNWEQRTARNFYALVRPNHPPSHDAPAALMFSTRYDASSLVPDLAPGASQAIQAAAGLRLLRKIAAHPWDRPVVVFFSGADSIQFLGTRNMLMALGDPPATWRDELASLDAESESAARDLNRARAAASNPASLSITDDRDLIARAIQIIETDQSLEQDELFRLRSQQAMQSKPATKEQINTLEARQVQLSRLKSDFQRKPADLADPAVASDARHVLKHVIDRLAGDGDGNGLLRQYAARKSELNDRIALYQWLASATSRPLDPDESRTDTRLIDLLVGLDFSDRGSACGPMFFGNFQRISGMPQIQEFRDWFTSLERDCDRGVASAQWWRNLKSVINLEPLAQRRLPPTYLAAPMAIPSELAQAWGVPGLSMITLDDLRLFRDTPDDTLDRIDLKQIIPQLDAVAELFQHATSDPDFRGPDELRRLTADITGQVVSPAPGMPVPSLPRPGFLATYYYVASKDKKIPQLGSLPWTLGVRRDEVRACDAMGRYRFEGLPRLRAQRLEGIEKQQADLQLVDVQVYRMDPGGGAITATTDLGKAASDIRSVVDIREPTLPVRSLVFDCDEFTLTRLYDPRFLQALREIEPLDARRGATPQRFDLLLADEVLAGFVEPGTRLNLLLRYGQVGNRIALLNMPEIASSGEKGTSTGGKHLGVDPSPERAARGYTTAELNQLGSLPLATARDFYRLDDQRLRDYRKAGVSSARVDDLHASTQRQIEAAARAVRADDGAALVRAATGAWASEARVYDAAQAMARDVIRAAILLLILCVPFSFCIERLLIATPNIYRQIAGGCCIFAVMTLALWSFHPAFRISSSPLIVILAFAIILMSCIVIAVVYAKFDTELTRLRSGQGGPSTAGAAPGGTTARGAAGGIASAVMIGLASMRRRKFRTALTSITIVLITFALLSFTSTTRYVGTRTYPTGAKTAHSGIELRQRGFRPMPEILTDQLRADLSDPALKLPHPPDIVEQWWAVSTIEPNEQYNLVAGKHVVSIPAVLGLSPGASRISSIADVLGQKQFARLERGEQNIIYISRNLADRLGVHENSILRLGGIDLTVAGAFDGARYDRQVRNLSGDALAPLKYTAGQLDAGGRSLDDTSAGSLDLSGSAEASTSYEFLSADDFAIIPANLCRTLYKSALRSVSIRLDDQQQVQTVSDQLARRFSLALFAGYDDGVRMVAAGNLSKVNGSGAVAVPLAVAALIIFNTMLGSIAERRREIHIYTSLGLAPLHVGALFVAEAMVYGLLGTVFGYIIGQGTAMLLQHLGWLGTVTLNFSGTSAILTMGLVLLIVLLSSLIPARVASKIASPSIDRTWKVPRPDGDLIRASLPFTIDQRAADGALAYLAEFFDAHREGAIGKFAAGAVVPIREDGLADGKDEKTVILPTDARQPSRGLSVPIWLTPFDLGVRQQLTLLVHPSEIPDIYEVDVVLKRLRGDDRNWHRMNRTFLTELRRQFLRWRSLTPQRMQEYIDQSRQRFTPQRRAEPQEAIA
jgi:hypothetical protein